jgi:protein arginine kinase
MRIKQTARYCLHVPSWFDGQGPDAAIVVSTRIRVARNLAGHRFLTHATPQERTAIYKKIVSSLGGQSVLKSFVIVNFSAVSGLERQLLAEKKVTGTNLLNGEGTRGVAHDHGYRVNIIINADDHLCINCIDSGFRPVELWNCADSIDERLGRELDFAYDQCRGFLTCRPIDSGSGLRVSFLMHLPGLVLTRSIDAILQGASTMGVAVSGFFSGHSGVIGNFILLSSNAAAGMSETEFIDSTRRVIAEVVCCEREARLRLIREARLELTDRIYRAYGILRHARTLSIVEYMNLASALRLGCDTGLFSDISLTDLNQSMLLVMPAHLQYRLKRTMDETECGVARAEFVSRLLNKKRKRSCINLAEYRDETLI